MHQNVEIQELKNDIAFLAGEFQKQKAQIDFLAETVNKLRVELLTRPLPPAFPREPLPPYYPGRRPAFPEDHGGMCACPQCCPPAYCLTKTFPADAPLKEVRGDGTPVES